MVNFIMDTFGKDQAVGFNIGCSFDKTVKASTLLADKAMTLGLQVVVNAFHGWAHNWLCQLVYHPLYCHTLGLEDLETLERVFSSSNLIAHTIHHTSKFHWAQYVDLHFQQWDANKYQQLCKYRYYTI